MMTVNELFSSFMKIFILAAIMISFTLSDIYASEILSADSLAFFFNSEIEDTTSTIQSVPSKYKWLFAIDSLRMNSWIKDSRDFILPIDFNMCHLPDRGRFCSNRVATTIPHTGIDLYANDRTDVLAAMAGKVIYVGNIIAKGKAKAFGGTIIIEHTNDSGKSNSYFSIYAHLNKKSIKVSLGNEVAQGQIIAKAGNSGNARGYPTQVHFEIRKTKNPLFAQIRLGSKSSYKQVQLLDPEVIYRREQFYVLLHNIDTKEMLDRIEKNLPEEFAHDGNILDYISQIRQHLSRTIYPVEPLQLMVAAQVNSDGLVLDTAINPYLAQNICAQTQSFQYYSIDSIHYTNQNYYQNIRTSLKKTRFKNHLTIGFTLSPQPGVRLFYTKSDNQVNSLSYQNGKIINKVESLYPFKNILVYKKLALVEFGCVEEFWQLDKKKYSRLVIQLQNLIGHWARERDDIIMVTGRNFTNNTPNKSALGETCKHATLAVPDRFIAKLFLLPDSTTHIEDSQLKTLITHNISTLQIRYKSFKEQSKRIIQDYDSKLIGTSFTFEQLQDFSKQLDSFYVAGILDSQQVKKRYGIINKFGLHAANKMNDLIWDVLDKKDFKQAMDLFAQYSPFFLYYAEEQYTQVFKRLEDYKRMTQKLSKTARQPMDKTNGLGGTTLETSFNETTKNVRKGKNKDMYFDFQNMGRLQNDNNSVTHQNNE